MIRFQQIQTTVRPSLKLNLSVLLLWLLCACNILACQNTALEDTTQSVSKTQTTLEQIAQIGASKTLEHSNAKAENYHFFQKIMGTHFQVQLIAFDKQTSLSAARASFNEARRIEHLMSSWRKQSEIGLLNQNAGLKPIAISYETAWLLCQAKHLSSVTRGSFDVTWASLKGLWDFKTHIVPKHTVLLQRLKAVGAEFIELEIKDQSGQAQSCKSIDSLMPHPIWTRFEDPSPPQWQWLYQAKLTHPQSEVDLGGIAKGYAIDSMARLLKRLGYKDFIVDGGGDLLVSGRSHTQEPWQVGIQHPRHEKLWGSLWVPSGWSVVTSGDYERFFYHNDQRYHHIIDLRTGYPAQGSVAMTVIAQSALMADVLATALFILGPYEGIALADSMSGVEAICFAPSGEVLFTHGAHIFSPSLPSRWK